jgi:hypothetical protein
MALCVELLETKCPRASKLSDPVGGWIIGKRHEGRGSNVARVDMPNRNSPTMRCQRSSRRVCEYARVAKWNVQVEIGEIGTVVPDVVPRSRGQGIAKYSKTTERANVRYKCNGGTALMRETLCKHHSDKD